MADYPPFMNATGLVSRILTKIKEAKTPDRFTQDFLGTNLGFTSGSAKAFIPMAKRLGLLAADGSPTELYKSFRNPGSSGAAMTKALKQGYTQLYDRNEYAHKLDRKALEGLIMEATGLEAGNKTLLAIRGTFDTLKGFANFDMSIDDDKAQDVAELEDEEIGKGDTSSGLKMNLAYTINLNLPKTDDIAVFNAIFKSLREHLLKQ